MSTARPLIAIPARFSASASALRYAAEVTARAVVASVYAAGGEPLVVHPHAPGATVDDAEVADRLAFADGVLLPGGGDLAARWSGQRPHPTAYDVDEEQDAFDLAVARTTLARGVPLLAVCRGLQVVNVARGGTLHQDMGTGDHRHHVHPVTFDEPVAGLPASLTASCYHHQSLDRLGAGLRPVAHAADGIVEAVLAQDAPGWFLGVQWHPEDTALADPDQLAVFTALVDAARLARSGA